MMKMLALCIVATVLILLPSGGDAECCKSHSVTVRMAGTSQTAKLCDDCSEGKPYCSKTGTCNMFGCNCDGGCRTGECGGGVNELNVDKIMDDLDKGLKELTDSMSSWRINDGQTSARRSETAHDVIRAADKDMDGLMSLGEARDHLASEGIPAHRLARSLAALDTDEDSFLSAREID